MLDVLSGQSFHAPVFGCSRLDTDSHHFFRALMYGVELRNASIHEMATNDIFGLCKMLPVRGVLLMRHCHSTPEETSPLDFNQSTITLRVICLRPKDPASSGEIANRPSPLDRVGAANTTNKCGRPDSRGHRNAGLGMSCGGHIDNIC